MADRYRDTEVVTLLRSEAERLADAVVPVVKSHGSREKAARALGLSQATLQKASSRGASVTMRRGLLDELGRTFQLDVSGWGS